MGHVGWHWDVGHTGDVGTWDVWGSTGTWVALVAPWGGTEEWGTAGGTGMWGTKEVTWGPGTCGAVCGVYGVMWGLRMWGHTWGGTEMWGSTGGDVGPWDVWGGMWKWDTWGHGTHGYGARGVALGCGAQRR